VGEAALLAGLGVVLVAGSVTAEIRQVPPRRPLDLLGWSIIGLVFLAVPLRRRWPRLTLVGAAAATGLFLAIGYPYGPVFFVVAIVGYSLAAHSPPREAGLGLLGAVAILAVTQIQVRPADRLAGQLAVLLLASAVWLGIPAWLGFTVQLWRRHAAEVRDRRRRSELAEQEQAERAAMAERLRLSREVHDIVAHSLSMISLRAGAALHVIARQPAEAEAALRSIRESSGAALRELRQAVASLREAAPTAGAADLTALVERVSGDQVKVTLDVEGEQRALPAEVDGCLYRIAQESLTNVVRHAGAPTAQVRLRYADDAVALEVTDNGSGVPTGAPGAGHGIAGMRERAEELGGFIEAGAGPAGGFRVYAWLPTGDAR